MIKKNIAILGATSHIAKGLINNFLNDGNVILHLFTRSHQKVADFLESIGRLSGGDYIIHEGYEDFLKLSYDVVINCVGTGTMKRMHGDYSSYFTITEKCDNLVIEYLLRNTKALYIDFSSGSVYGRGFSEPAGENTTNNIKVNHVSIEDYYSIARLNSEAKHRSLDKLNIVDLRIFSYFSRFIDLSDGYFITDIMESIKDKKILTISSQDFIRDYLHPQDLYSMILKCFNIGKINSSFDVNSSKPVTKKEMLDYFSSVYGLEYQISETMESTSSTGIKNVYYSKYDNAKTVGYKPSFSSMDAIVQESKYILNN
ncbi:MAG: NAD-dependent epimerase/dehydratase family protein [Patescibacteria group bacterium]|jgi:nucleoside-diphosphate-sugar epimerase